MYQKYMKRLFDLTMSFILIILLIPVFLILAILIRLKFGSPILFRQDRPGKDGKIFTMYKFRTMNSKVDDNGLLLPDSMRLTSFGKLIRSTSLDELPELFNIFKGEMSFVGPRPLLVQYLPLYTPEQMRRHDVRPGLTGLAQINGRNAISWEDKFKYDIRYVNQINLMLDLKIVQQTIKKVIIREGINSDKNVSMEPFQGSNIQGGMDE